MTYTYTRALDQPHGVRLVVWFEPDILSVLPAPLMPGYEDIYSIHPTSPAPGGIRLDTLMPNAKFVSGTIENTEKTKLMASLETSKRARP
jgi:hypothetical protein